MVPPGVFAGRENKVVKKMEEELTYADRRMFCPFRQGDCKKEECMVYVIVGNARLGCAYNLIARKMDSMEFMMKKKNKEIKEDYSE
jgi:hypothetical protein